MMTMVRTRIVKRMMMMTVTKMMMKWVMTETFEVPFRPLVEAAVSRIKAASSTRPLIIIIVIIVIIVIIGVIVIVVIIVVIIIINVIIVVKLDTWRAASEEILL